MKDDHVLFNTLVTASESGCGYFFMSYQLCLQPLTASGSAAVALALHGPAQS